MPKPPYTLGIDIGGTSVKLAALRGDGIAWNCKRGYRQPTVEDLVAAIQSGLSGRDSNFDAIGLCVPGLLDAERTRVTLSVNVPALMEIRFDTLIERALGQKPEVMHVANDSIASGYDLFALRGLCGRLLAIAIGTGVGAAVLDDGVPLCVEADSPGHIGQMDVSIAGAPVIGPDGGAGSLEGYIGAPALRRRYGTNPAGRMRAGDPPLLALARAIRICHAMYRPHHVLLAGGLGIRLGRLLPDLRRLIETDLTSVARSDWTLGVGENDYHAASGAARLALRELRTRVQAKQEG